MKKILALALALVTLPAMAAGTQTGNIVDIYVRDSDGLLLVSLTGTASGHPSCATAAYWIIPSETTDTGKTLYATLLAAKLSGHSVTIAGKNTCTRWFDGEDIESVDVH